MQYAHQEYTANIISIQKPRVDRNRLEDHNALISSSGYNSKPISENLNIGRKNSVNIQNNGFYTNAEIKQSLSSLKVRQQKSTLSSSRPLESDTSQSYYGIQKTPLKSFPQSRGHYGFSQDYDQRSKAQDTTATSDFQNRFKGKIQTMKKDGVMGVVARTNQPIEKVNYTKKLDQIGFTSGMSGVSSITTQILDEKVQSQVQTPVPQKKKQHQFYQHTKPGEFNINTPQPISKKTFVQQRINTEIKQYPISQSFNRMPNYENEIGSGLISGYRSNQTPTIGLAQQFSSNYNANFMQRKNSQQLNNSPIRQNDDYSKPYRSSSYNNLNDLSYIQDINNHRVTQQLTLSQLDHKRMIKNRQIIQPLDRTKKLFKKQEDNYFELSSIPNLPQIHVAPQMQSVMTVHNDQKLFGQMQGLGPVNIGTQEWNQAKIKQQRMNTYVNKINRKPR